LFRDITTPCRPSGLLTGHPSPYRLDLYNSYLIYNYYNDISSKSSEIAGSEAGAPVKENESCISKCSGRRRSWTDERLLAGIAMEGGGYGLLWDIISVSAGASWGAGSSKPWVRRRQVGAGRDCRVVGAVLMITLQAQDLARAGRGTLRNGVSKRGRWWQCSE